MTHAVSGQGDEHPAAEDEFADVPEGAEEERESVFAPLPPARGRGFATTWWGLRWLKALEQTALDTEQLKRGKRVARAGAVGAVSVRSGRITAVVHGTDRSVHRADVLLREFDAAEWDGLCDVLTAEGGHLAALLDGEMPPRLVEDAESAGVELLPGVGDLEPECACGAWDHCAHTAALSYQTARLLDQDPFALLLLRGRSRRTLLEELHRRAAAAPSPAAAPQGVPAQEVFALGVVVPPLPAPPALPGAPGEVPLLEGAPAHELDTEALADVLDAATRRAHQALAAALAPGHASEPLPEVPTADVDAVRLAAACTRPQVTRRLAAGSGRTTRELAAAVAAWRSGGADGLAVLERPWQPDAEQLAAARERLEAEASPEPDSVEENRWTWASVQLRLAPDGRWWPYRQVGGGWWPAGGPEHDCASAYAVAAAEAEDAARLG